MNLERAVELLKRADSESKIAGLRHLPVEVINNDGIMDLVLDALTGDEPDTRYAAIQVLKKAGFGGQDLAAAIPLLMAVCEDARFPSHRSKAKNTALSIGCEASGGCRLLPLAARRCASVSHPRNLWRLAGLDGVARSTERENGTGDQAVLAAVARDVGMQ
jgi:hypothetical protein